MAERKKKGKIAIFCKTTSTQKALKEFFQKRPHLQYEVFTNAEQLRDVLEKDKFDLLMVEAHCVPEDLLDGQSLKKPTIAIISEHIPLGLQKVLKCDLDCYLIPPFDEDTLEYKLETLLKGDSYLERLSEENRQMEALLEISFLITSTLEPREILYFVVKKVAEVIKPDRCSILSISYASPRYAHVVSTYESREITKLKLDLKKYPEIKEAIKRKTPVIIKDALKDPLMRPVVDIIRPIGIKSIAVIPMIHRDEVIGAFFLRTSKRRKDLHEREIRFCQSVANISANALYNALLYEKLSEEHRKLKKLAITDYLTGVYNIRYFYHRLEEEFSRAQRYGHPLSCIMMDIDYFKSVNDRFGHKTGDAVLREFAQLVKRHTRRSDVFARYGGEEFIMLLPHTPLDGAQKEAERLRKYIREHQFKGLRGQRITASFGVSCWPVHKVKTPDDLINYADQALFMAKNEGRDRIVVFPQEP